MATWPDGANAIASAIRAWVLTASGLAANHVIWSGQGGPRPPGTWISLLVRSVISFGQDADTTEDADDPEPGAELTHRLHGPRELVLSLQCYKGAASGSSSGLAVLERVKMRARQDAIQGALRAAGVGVLGIGAVTDSAAVLPGTIVFEPRAIAEARLSVAAEIVSTGTFIEFVRFTTTVDDITLPGVWVPEAPPE